MTLRGRFGKDLDDRVKRYTVSLPFDQRLYRQDIAGSIAHARMLARQGIITEKDAERLIMGLASIREEIERGEFEFKDELEDIHMNIEARLVEKVGEVGDKLHTARSRNDQVATDLGNALDMIVRNTLMVSFVELTTASGGGSFPSRSQRGITS